MRPGIIRGVAVVACVMLGARVSRTDDAEDPETERQRLANIQAERKLGHTPWQLTASITRSETHATTGPGYQSKTTVAGSGHAELEFFPDADMGPAAFMADPDSATWIVRRGGGDYASELHERVDDAACKDQLTTDITATGQIPCKAHFELADGTWSASVGCDGDVAEQDVRVARGGDANARCPTQRTSDRRMAHASFAGECTQDSPGAHLARTKNGWTVDCTIAEPTQTTRAGARTTTSAATTHVHLEISGKPAPRYEAILEPVAPAAWKAWRPEGPALDGSPVGARHGNTIGVRVTLRDPDTHRPVTAPYTTTFTLQSSAVPGVAMNYPGERARDRRPDLYFDDPRAARDQQQLDARGGAPVTITSRDWGAYGAVRARVFVDGQEVTTWVGFDHQAPGQLQLPLDEDGNHIADAWDTPRGRHGADPRADEEDDGGLFTKGDGYGLYEEYRGFYLQPASARSKADRAEHVELDPDRRDELIAISAAKGDQVLGYRGAATFGQVSRFAVHFVPSADYLGRTGNDLDGAHPRRANFNGDGGSVEQDATWVVFDIPAARPQPGTTPNLPGVPDEGYASPNEALAVFVSVAKARDEVDNEIDGVADPALDAHYSRFVLAAAQAELARRGVSLARFKTRAAGKASDLARRLAEFTVIHELGHAAGAKHHDQDGFLRCEHACTTDADCGTCSPFTATSRHQTACSVVEGMGLRDVEAHLAVPAERAQLRLRCYAGQPERYGGGDAGCPMRYWHFLDGVAVVKFLLAEWNPATGPAGGGAWAFCAENRPTMRLHQRPGDWMRP